MTTKLKRFLVLALLGMVGLLVVTGCFRLRTGAGSIYYEAKSAAAVRAFNSSIEPLRAALRRDGRFTDVTSHRTMDFVGVAGSEFDGCWIGYHRDENNIEKDRHAVMVASTCRTFGVAGQVRHLRGVIERALGPQVVEQLDIHFDSNMIDVR